MLASAVSLRNLEARPELTARSPATAPVGPPDKEEYAVLGKRITPPSALAKFCRIPIRMFVSDMPKSGPTPARLMSAYGLRSRQKPPRPRWAGGATRTIEVDSQSPTVTLRRRKAARNSPTGTTASARYRLRPAAWRGESADAPSWIRTSDLPLKRLPYHCLQPPPRAWTGVPATRKWQWPRNPPVQEATSAEVGGLQTACNRPCGHPIIRLASEGNTIFRKLASDSAVFLGPPQTLW
jgi:hypothetical protein